MRRVAKCFGRTIFLWTDQGCVVYKDQVYQKSMPDFFLVKQVSCESEPGMYNLSS